jgi:membrane-anchored mycosin MYCP
VIGVGAVDLEGNRLSQSQVGPYVDLVAPGGAVVGATRRGGHSYFSGTSFAAPFVAGAAALVRAAWPQLNAKQVAQRLLATASPARGGSATSEYGVGMIDPYRAVTDGLSKARPQAMPAMAHPAPDQVMLDAQATERRLVSSAWQRTGLVVGVAMLILLVALILPAGLRQRWTPARAAPLPSDRPQDEPPDQLFLLPPPPSER